MSKSKPRRATESTLPTGDIVRAATVPADAPPAPQFETRPFPALANRAIDIVVADAERQINAIIAEAGELVGVPAADGWEPDVRNRRFVRAAAPPTPTD